ncbi:MAG: NAAT family transporter [Rhodospirillaceae bacterium]|nr:NAAT family transporter [Rhodospirillaceae bacterium]
MDPALVEIGLLAFTTFFATISPVDVAALYAAMTPKATDAQRRTMAIKGTLIAGVIMLVFALLGDEVLKRLGITLPAMKTAGGILLLLIAIDMVFARPSGGSSTTEDETEEAGHKEDVSVFPLATPLIAGPGTMGAVILLSAKTDGNIAQEMAIIVAIVAILIVTLGMLLMAGRLQKLLGITGLNVITRVVGVLLAALAVQFIFDGIASSGLLR